MSLRHVPTSEDIMEFVGQLMQSHPWVKPLVAAIDEKINTRTNIGDGKTKKRGKRANQSKYCTAGVLEIMFDTLLGY